MTERMIYVGRHYIAFGARKCLGCGEMTKHFIDICVENNTLQLCMGCTDSVIDGVSEARKRFESDKNDVDTIFISQLVDDNGICQTRKILVEVRDGNP